MLTGEDSEKKVTNLISKRGVQDKAEANLSKWKNEGKTHRRMSQEPLRQTARERDPSAQEKKLFDEEEYQEEEEDLFNILQEERQHWKEV